MLVTLVKRKWGKNLNSEVQMVTNKQSIEKMLAVFLENVLKLEKGGTQRRKEREKKKLIKNIA